MLTVISENGLDPCRNLKSDRMNFQDESKIWCPFGLKLVREGVLRTVPSCRLWGCNTPKSTGVCRKFYRFQAPLITIIVKWIRPINVAERLERDRRRTEIARWMLPGLRNQGRQWAGRMSSNHASNIDRPIPLNDNCFVLAFMTFAFLDLPDFWNYAFSTCQTFDISDFLDFLI